MKNNHPNEENNETLPEGILSTLKNLPSERGSTSAKTDENVMRLARQRLDKSPRLSVVSRPIAVLGGIAACLMLTFFIYHAMMAEKNQGSPTKNQIVDAKENENFDEAAVILKEVEQLFSGKLKAIEYDESGMQIILSEKANPNNREGVVIECEYNGKQWEIITFVGSTIDIADRKVKISSGKDGSIKLTPSDKANSSSKLIINARKI